VGVIFLSLLSKCYPFFKSHDDYEALAEIITIFGDSKLKKTALALGKNKSIFYFADHNDFSGF
jgi:cell division control protein 7